MMKKLTISAVAALGLVSGAAFAAGDAPHIHDTDFSFEGPFGTFDQNQLQRGLKVYTESCSACHGMKFVPIRTLSDEGGPHLPEDQVRAYAAEFTVLDEDANHHLYDPEAGELRALKPSDNFPANTTANAPDLSLMAKARAGFHGPEGTGLSQLFNGIGGPEYIVAILTGYEETPSCAPDDFDGHYNTAFAAGGYPDECKIYEDKETVLDDGTVKVEKVEVGRKYPGSWIGMAPPLEDGSIDFDDGHSNDLHHIAEDTAAFLMWAAEPKMMNRKKVGFVAVGILALLSVLLYLTNKKLWAPHKGKEEEEA